MTELLEFRPMKDFKILIYGYGNPGRQDDGLGNAFVERLSAWVAEQKLKGFEFDSNYQLNIEDADAIADKDIVIFIDASTEEIKDFLLTLVNPEAKVSFTSHSASPGYIAQLCRELYGKNPAVYLLHIKGYQWEFMEGLTEKAKINLEISLEKMKEKLVNPGDLMKPLK